MVSGCPNRASCFCADVIASAGKSRRRCPRQSVIRSRRTSMWASPRTTSTGSSRESSAQPMAAVSLSLVALSLVTSHSLGIPPDVTNRRSISEAAQEKPQHCARGADTRTFDEPTGDLVAFARLVRVGQPQRGDELWKRRSRRVTQVRAGRRSPAERAQPGKSRWPTHGSQKRPVVAWPSGVVLWKLRRPLTAIPFNHELP